ncbi:MAG: phosphatase PAP2 family protein [Chloroflexota bacterium]
MPDFTRLLALDAAWTQRFRIAERPGLLRRLAIVFAHSGDSWFWGLGLGLVILFGSPAWRYRALVLLLATGGLAVLVLAIKFSVRRSRPQGEWGAIYRKTDPHSFPSGHAARAVMLAALAAGLGPGWFGALLIAWAPLVVLARVAMGVHYLSDVLAGALLGLLAGAAIWLAL